MGKMNNQFLLRHRHNAAYMLISDVVCLYSNLLRFVVKDRGGNALLRMNLVRSI